MANLLRNGVKVTQGQKNPCSLNKLELLDHPQCLQGFHPKNETQYKLQKKAQNSYFSRQLAQSLMQLDSKLNSAYSRTFYDCCTTIVQQGQELTSRYCKARWCNVCNRIRTAHLMNGYLIPLNNLKEPQFVTLTIPNVNTADLKHSLRQMVSTSTKIARLIKRQKNSFNGIRKIECTYNAIEDNYHPHFHFILEGKEIAELLRKEWLMRNNDCNPIAQKIIPVYDNSAKELFKYSTKIVTESNKGLNIYVSALDTIFNAMKGMRTFQAFGNVKKVSEDIEDLNSQLYEDIEQYDFVLWKWNNNDWFNMLYGNSLSGYIPNQSMLELTTTRMII